MPDIRALLRNHEMLLTTVIVMLAAILAIKTDSFLSWRNLEDLVTSNAYTAILCAGLIVVLVSGKIDISFAAVASVAQYSAFWLLELAGNNWAGLFFVATAVGIACGIVNAVLTQYLRLGSIIATIATMNIFFGLLMFFSKGQYISAMPDWFSDGITLFTFVDTEGFKHRIGLQIVLVIVSFAMSFAVLHLLNLGKQIYAVGGNTESARRFGLNATGLAFFAFGYLGFMAALAGIAQAQLAQTIVPNALVGTELNVLAAVILGGANLAGGRGTVLGTILGVALLAILHNGLVLVGVSSYWVQVFSGGIVLGAASLAVIRDRGLNMRRGNTAHV